MQLKIGTWSAEVRLPTLGESIAAGRHAVTFTMGAIAMAAAFHLISQSDASALKAAVDQITNGVVQVTNGMASIIGGVSTVVAFLSAVWAAKKQSPDAQVLAVANNPQVEHIAVTPELAAKIDHDKVVAK